MKNIFFLTLTIVGSLLSLSCEKDNYDMPNAKISGRIIDKTTGLNVPLQKINGGGIRLFQTDLNANPTSINSNFESDGTYANNMIFEGNYRLVLDGPFFYEDTVSVAIKGSVIQDIKVRPYLEVNAEVFDITETSAKVKVKTKLGSGNLNQKIARVVGLISTSKSLDINFFMNERGLTNTEDVPNSSVEGKEYIYQFNNLKPKTKYYIRGGARTINTGNLYNYAPIIEIQTK